MTQQLVDQLPYDILEPERDDFGRKNEHSDRIEGHKDKDGYCILDISQNTPSSIEIPTSPDQYNRYNRRASTQEPTEEKTTSITTKTRKRKQPTSRKKGSAECYEGTSSVDKDQDEIVGRKKTRPYNFKKPEEKNETYKEGRKKNNDAVRKCREKKEQERLMEIQSMKAKDERIAMLEADHTETLVKMKTLENQVDEQTKTIKEMRDQIAILTSQVITAELKNARSEIDRLSTQSNPIGN